MEKDHATKVGHEVKGVGPDVPRADHPKEPALPIR